MKKNKKEQNDYNGKYDGVVVIVKFNNCTIINEKNDTKKINQTILLLQYCQRPMQFLNLTDNTDLGLTDYKLDLESIKETDIEVIFELADLEQRVIGD